MALGGILHHTPHSKTSIVVADGVLCSEYEVRCCLTSLADAIVVLSSTCTEVCYFMCYFIFRQRSGLVCPHTL